MLGRTAAIVGGMSAFGLLSPIRDDEVVLFFPGLAHPVSEEDGGGWNVDIHGWIYEPEEDSAVRAALVEAFRKALGLEKARPESGLLEERARWFLVDNERGKEISIRLGGREHKLGESQPNGHFRGSLSLGEEEFRALLAQRPAGAGPLRFRAVTREDDARVFAGAIQVIERKGLSVVSDVDDTVKVSDTPNRAELLANTFLREYRPVSGMAELYRSFERSGASFHYVSASPWQLYRPLSQFLGTNGFPSGTFALRDFRLKDSSFLDLFESPFEHKLSAIESIFETLPERRFILIGDSTEKDPEVYGELARRYPGRVERILIREVEGSRCDEARLRQAFESVSPRTWMVFREPSEALPADERRI